MKYRIKKTLLLVIVNFDNIYFVYGTKQHVYFCFFFWFVIIFDVPWPWHKLIAHSLKLYNVFGLFALFSINVTDLPLAPVDILLYSYVLR